MARKEPNKEKVLNEAVEINLKLLGIKTDENN